MNRIAGVDEAGRGAVIGPLVVAAVSIEADSIERLIELGVKDSKLLDRRSRITLYNRILELGSSAVCIAEPKVIDEYVCRHALNLLEARMVAHVLTRLKPLLAYVDACDTKPERFSAMIARMLDKNDTSMMISSAHKADRDNVLVGAASIIAKVVRDSIINDMKRRCGDFGSGYPSDIKTRRFIEHLLTDGIVEKEDDDDALSNRDEHCSILASIDVSYLDGANCSNGNNSHGYHSRNGMNNSERINYRFDFIRYSWKPVRLLLTNNRLYSDS
ncbi:MAG: ribonuclease HII [Candidatus Nitrosocaldus sp.]